MMLILCQIAVVAALAVGFGRWRAGVRRQHAQSWDSLVARLRPDCGLRAFGDPNLWNKGVDAAPEEQWRRIQGAVGLWTIYER